MMRHYYFIDGDGHQCFASTESAFLPLGAKEVPRLPDAFESWDEKAGGFFHDAEGEANDAAGPDHIAAMHIQKAIEAHLIAAGISAPTMVLVREAALRGVKADVLAATVLDKVAAAESKEIERQAVSLSVAKLRRKS